MPPQHRHPRPPNRFSWWQWEQPPGCSTPMSVVPVPVPAVCPPPAPRPLLTPGAGGGCHLPSRPAVPAEADGDGRRRSGRSRVSPCHEPAGPQPPGDSFFAVTALRGPAVPAVAPVGALLSLQPLPPAVASHPATPQPTPMGGPGWRGFAHTGVTWAVPTRVSPETLFPVGGEAEAGRGEGCWGRSADCPPWVCPYGDTGDASHGCPQLRGRGHQLPGREVTELQHPWGRGRRTWGWRRPGPVGTGRGSR